MQNSFKDKPAFELKGSLFTLTVLHLLSVDSDHFAMHLASHVSQSPHLFNGMPIVIDLVKVAASSQKIDFLVLQTHLRANGLIPVAVKRGTEAQHQEARAVGFAIVSQSMGAQKSNEPNVSKSMASPARRTMVLHKPVRSGQQVHAKGSDLIILASVNHGAELLADGHIHVYGCLRGRALAGIHGDKAARIFCHVLEAELVAIAGHYRLNEGFPIIKAPMTQVYLVDEKICIQGLLEGSDPV